jgi:putative flippase GtrA
MNKENISVERGTMNKSALMPDRSFYTYLRSQFAALFATIADFSITIFLKEIIGIWYLIAVGIGAGVGAITAFFLNRNWVFKTGSRSIRVQAFRYGLVSGGSWVLNTGGVYLLTESTGISYIYSKVIVSIFIGLSYNYIMAKRFVFV